MSNISENLLEMVGVTKEFPGVVANDHISLEICKGEVHGLLGENGAGKTTLMKILYGMLQPDTGQILVNGKQVRITSPKIAVENGIGMVHQHFMLMENLSVLENVILGLEDDHSPLLNLDSARNRFVELSKQYDLDLDPSAKIWQIPVGMQQWLEILKLLYRDVNILILDEPTAVLAPSQVTKLFEIIRKLVSEGRSVIFISHKMEEVKEITDRVTVLRDGKVVGTVKTSDASSAELAAMMVGRDVSLDRRERPEFQERKAVLKVEAASCLNERNILALNELTLTVHSGEIVGIAGVDGNGQRELAEAIAGLCPLKSGKIWIEGHLVKGVVQDTTLLGYIPEDRHKSGLVISFNVAENLIIKKFSTAPFQKNGFLHWKVINQEAEQLITQCGIKASNSLEPVRNLSGGNQQKVVLAREISAKPALLVAVQPTRGLDMGAVEGIHQSLLEERNRGAAVLFVSTELSEVMALSDRIIVLSKGQIMGELDGKTADVKLIGEMMLGRKLSDLPTA